MNALDELKQLSTEVTAAIATIEAEQVSDAPPEPTNYSSSVTSVTVDPDTGVISVALTLHPGDQPINPVPDSPEEKVVTDAIPPGQNPAE